MCGARGDRANTGYSDTLARKGADDAAMSKSAKWYISGETGARPVLSHGHV